MSINIENVVKVNFKVDSPVSTIGTYTTVAYVYSAATANKLYYSQEEVETDYTEESQLTRSSDLFFKLGGKALYIIKDNSVAGIKAIKESVQGTASDFIFVCLANNLSAENVLEIIKGVELFKAPNELCVCFSTDTKEAKVNDESIANYNVALKYPATIGINTVDTALSIGAFYSQVNLGGSNTVQDYCYTDESAYFTDSTVANLSQADYTTLMNANINVTDAIGSKIVDFGGDLVNGVSITSYFGAIVSENAVINSVLTVMLNKLPLSNNGLTSVVNAIQQSLSSLIDAGYIMQNSVYEGSSKYVVYNTITYTILSKGEALPNGYKVFTIPMARITVEDKSNKQFTPIYVIIMTQLGARIVNISGDIIA